MARDESGLSQRTGVERRGVGGGFRPDRVLGTHASRCRSVPPLAPTAVVDRLRPAASQRAQTRDGPVEARSAALHEAVALVDRLPLSLCGTQSLRCARARGRLLPHALRVTEARLLAEEARSARTTRRRQRGRPRPGAGALAVDLLCNQSPFATLPHSERSGVSHTPSALQKRVIMPVKPASQGIDTSVSESARFQPPAAAHMLRTARQRLLAPSPHSLRTSPHCASRPQGRT